MIDLTQAKKDFNSIADYIVEIDEEGKFVLLKKDDFCKSIIELSDENFISVYFEFEDLFTCKLLSAHYIAEQWQNIESFRWFINDRMENIDNEIDREWQRDIIKFVRSDKPTIEKVDYLVELIADIGVNEIKLKDTEVLKPMKKFLQILFKELKDKKKFERTKRSQIPNESEILANNSLNDFPKIFKDDGYGVFIQLNEKYQNNNKKLPTKYSNLFHYLKYSDLLRCQQNEYIDFIKQEYNVNLSKIYPQTYKYKNDIQPLLMKYHKGQQ